MSVQKVYQEIIIDHLTKANRLDIDPRHVEGWMRLEHGTLGHLSPQRFAAEIRLCIKIIDNARLAGRAADNERLAKSYGL